MDFPFGGGAGQTSQLSLATATASPHDLNLISAAAAAAAAATVTSSSSATETSTASAAAAATTSAFHHFNGHDNGPILFDNLNRTSAIDDIRSAVIYIFIITIFLSFFLILPGIRNEKFPTFLCITTSLLVSSIIIISLNGTTWHVSEAPISAPYKAFSRDRIQGDLSVRIGLQSVNISLKAHKYYILHATNGPMIMENTQPSYSLLQQPLMMVMMSQPSQTSPSSQQPPKAGANESHGPDLGGDNSELYSTTTTLTEENSAAASSFIKNNQNNNDNDDKGRAQSSAKENLADELAAGRTSDGGLTIDTELEVDEPFSGNPSDAPPPVVNSRRIVRSSANASSPTRTKRQQPSIVSTTPRYTIKRIHVDINYNERFYWIGPMQMRQEFQSALERGLPYPILTCVEYLSQDEAGFNWSRRYRAAGYYTSMLLWLSASVCVLMFCLHCAAPKYGIYAMQALGVLLLCTNLTYATLVPRGDQKLVIPFEGQSVTFRLGWNFWLVLVGGCLSLFVGTTIVIIDKLFPNFIFTTVLDVDFDYSSSRSYFEKKHKIFRGSHRGEDDDDEGSEKADRSSSRAKTHKKPKMPPFMRESRKQLKKNKNERLAEPGGKLVNKGAVEAKSKVQNRASIDNGNANLYESIDHSGDHDMRRNRDDNHYHSQLSSNPGDIQKSDSKSLDKRDMNSREVHIRL